MTVLAVEGLADLLEARPDPMIACRSLPWLADFLEVPEDASAPLAMSGAHPRAVGSYGADCIEWTRDKMGIQLRWWQQLAITRQLEHDIDGALVWREVVESGPRRIGKSVRLRVTALWRLAHAHLFSELQLAMLVSKDLAVGKEIHRGAWRWAEEQDWGVTRLNGGQEIETPTGDRWLLRAPNAVYGYDVGYGQVDESWGVDPMAITDGLEPALLERQSPQLHLTSTAHVKASSLMRRRLTAALRSADPDVLLLLWGARPELDVTDPATWRQSSPHWTEDRRALIARKLAAAQAGQDEPEFDDPDPVRGWAAQYLNVWPLLLSSTTTGPMPTWAQCATAPGPVRPAALGVAMDRDRVWLSCGVVSAGPVPHVGPVTSGATGRTLRVRAADPEFGRAAFVEEVAQISKRLRLPVGLDLKGPAGEDLATDLTEAGARLMPGNLDDYVTACGRFYDAAEAKALSHSEYLELDQAVQAAGWRKVGDRRVWARNTGDISMLEAVTWALWASMQRPPRRTAGF